MRGRASPFQNVWSTLPPGPLTTKIQVVEVTIRVLQLLRVVIRAQVD